MTSNYDTRSCRPCLKFMIDFAGDINDDVERVRECVKVLDKDDVLIMDANTGSIDKSWNISECSYICSLL